jgi:hypothetical protein
MTPKADGVELSRQALQARLDDLYHELQEAARAPRNGARRRPGLRSVAAIEQDIAGVQRALEARRRGV